MNKISRPEYLLVNLWNNGDLPQVFTIQWMDHRPEISPRIVKPNTIYDFSLPLASQLRELADRELIRMDGGNIFLLQELRDAVENNFQMSLYVLATHGNQIAPELETMLGEMVEQNESLKAAIEQLSQVDRTDEKNFNQRLGNVIEQLGNSMAHGANATVVVQALVKIIQMSGLG